MEKLSTMDDAEINDLLTSKFPKARIMVIGDLMLDKYIFGSATRISPESPVPVLDVSHESYRLGGAANTAANLAGLGSSPFIAGLVGDDKNAQILREMLSPLAADLDGLIKDKDRPTTLKTRFLASHQQLLRTDKEDQSAIPVQHQEKILEYIHARADSTDVIILSDYNKGLFERDFALNIISFASKAGIPVLVDPKGEDYSRYQGADILTPNLTEIGRALGIPKPYSDKEVIDAGAKISSEYNIQAVLATRSKDGMTLIPHRDNSYGLEHPLHYRSEVVDIYDVSGAGDTAIATLGACLASGIILSEAVRIANIAAGLIVQKTGTASIQINELKAALTGSIENLNQRIYGSGSQDSARQLVEHWKAQGLKVGFTNGCFDILHSGHVAYLNETRRHCDRLVVGMNCDESVSRLKGQNRPVNPEEDRAAVLAGLKAVDMVVLFGDQDSEGDKAIELIERLKPEIYFKGGDYAEDDIPEAPVVRGYGGEIFICKPSEGRSTTLTIEKMKNSA